MLCVFGLHFFSFCVEIINWSPSVGDQITLLG